MPPVPPHRPFMIQIGGPGPSMASSVYDQLKDAIISCVFMPGENLHEAALASHFNVSKTPVREALHVLRREGYIESLARHGHRVSGIAAKDVHDIFDLRLLVEPAAAARAAEALDDATIEELRGLAKVHYTRGDRKSYDTFLTVNRRFHTLIASASGNERLSGLIERLSQDMERFFRLVLDGDDSATEMVHDHEAIVEALARRDGAEAERLTREQLETSKQRALDALGTQPFRRTNAPHVGIRLEWGGPGAGWRVHTTTHDAQTRGDAKD